MSNERKIYEAYGKFAIEFEMTCNALEELIRSILYAEGLHNPRIEDCLIAGLTADPLSSLAQSLCYEHLNPVDEDSKIIDFVFSEFQQLIAKRNDVVHGKHFIFFYEHGIKKPKPSERTFSVKLHKNKKGSATKHTRYSPEDLYALSKEATNSFKNFAKIKDCIEKKQGLSVNFEKFDQKTYIPRR